MSFFAVLSACLCALVATDRGDGDFLSTYVSSSGINHPSCITGGRAVPCRNIFYVAKETSLTSQRIVILDMLFTLDEMINFTAARDLTLSGDIDNGRGTTLKCICEESECGLLFRHSINISVLGINVTDCGAIASMTVLYEPDNVVYFKSALSVINCRGFTMRDCHFFYNYETGLFISRTNGYVIIQNSSFQGNGRCKQCHQSHGLVIEFTSNEIEQDLLSETERVNSIFILENCKIEDNNNNKMNQSYKLSQTGGGLSITFNGESSGNSIFVRHSNVSRNVASWGGGLFVLFAQKSHDNNITIIDCTFANNHAIRTGGGIDVGFINEAANTPLDNRILLEDCIIVNNTATSGGGTAVFSSHATCLNGLDEHSSSVIFKHTTWAHNSAHFSSAVDIAPYSLDTLSKLYLPRPKFVGCNFTSNNRMNHANEEKLVNSGSFTIFGFDVHFEDYVNFDDHTLSALHVTEGTITFLAGTVATFRNNTGSQGGAVSLHGTSSLFVYDNTILNFCNNTALDNGGAIFYSTQNHHDFITSRTCFLQSFDHKGNASTPIFIFQGNNAYQAGNSIFATTFLPCYFHQFRNDTGLTSSIEDSLQMIAKFHFDNNPLATAGKDFYFSGDIPFSVIPGKKFNISEALRMEDELHNVVPTVLRVLPVQVPEQCEIKPDRAYTLGTLVVYGQENSSALLSFSSVSLREVSFKVSVSLKMCSVGFFFDADKASCECCKDYKDRAYLGIEGCSNNRAKALNGYWIGYDTNNDVLTAPCPFSFCENMQTSFREYYLPETSSPDELEQVICRKNRRGILCGDCLSNFTVFFHSPTYKCGPEPLCPLGTLFFLLSEILPITCLVFIITLWDVRFTSGAVSGLILFAQIINTVSQDIRRNFDESNTLKVLGSIHRIIYGLFNFDFFNHNSLSFCLWKNASVLDVIAFRYISVVFAFSLLILLVSIVSFCPCKIASSLKKRFGINMSMIHGISAVIIMCYSQCTEVSLKILTKSSVQGAGGEKVYDVTLFGGTKYMTDKHLRYALPAIICIPTIILLLPTLLLLFPALMKLMSLLRMSETKAFSLILKIYIRVKPFLDSFQGCYKDNFRFFAGIYFFLRVFILIANAFPSSAIQSIIITELLLLLILGAHSLTQPFQKHVDNVIIGFVLLGLALINSLTILLFTEKGSESQDYVLTAWIVLWIRMILTYVPIVGVCVYVLAVGLQKIWKCKIKKHDSDNECLTTGHEMQERIIDHKYLPFQEFVITREELLEDS